MSHTTARFPLDNTTSSTLTLPSGRKLGYAQYGALAGKPVFFFHGLPGSRLDGAYFDALGKELGARIIAPDRPGCGWSSAQAGRSLLDWPRDVEALARELGIEAFAVMVGFFWGVFSGFVWMQSAYKNRVPQAAAPPFSPAPSHSPPRASSPQR